MVLYDKNDPLNPDPNAGLTQPDNGLYKTAQEAYRQDVVPAENPPRRGLSLAEPGTMVAQARTGTLADVLGIPATPSRGAPSTLADVLGIPATPSRGAPSTLADVLGLTPPPAEAPKAERGDFSRGFEVSGKQLKQTAYGTAALIGDTVGSDKLREWGLRGYKDAEKEVKAISKESDSFTTAFEQGEMGKWFAYSSGYLVGQVAELGVASLAGAALGSLAAPGGGTVAGAIGGAVEKGAVEAGVKSFVGKMIDKQVTANMARNMSAEAATELAVKQVYGKIGATTANTFLNATQELGSIYGDAVEEAALTGKEYSLGKVWLSGIMATAVDSWADSKAVGKLMDSVKGGKGIGGVAVEAFKGGFREGMTEGVQTAIERWGADKDTTSREAFKEYIDSAAVGVLGGTVAGGSSGAIAKFTKEADTTDTSTATQGSEKATQVSDTDITQTQDKAQPNLRAPVSFATGEIIDTLRNPEAVAFMYDRASVSGKKDIEAAVNRAGLTDEFKEAIANPDNIAKGEEKFAGDTAFISDMMGAIAGYGAGAEALAPKKSVSIKKENTAATEIVENTETKPAETKVETRVNPNQKNLNNVKLGDNNRALLESFFNDEMTAAREKGGVTGQKRIEALRGQMAKVGFSELEIERFATGMSVEEQQAQLRKNLADDGSDAMFKDLRLSRSKPGVKPTVSDLPEAIGKVMGALANRGTKGFLEVSAEVMRRMRESADWSDMAKNVTPAMLRNEYNKLNFDGKQSADEVAAVSTKQIRDAVATATKPKEAPKPAEKVEPTVDEEANQVELQILDENKTLEQEFDAQWSKKKVAPSDVPAVLAEIDKKPEAAAAFDRLEGLKQRQKELLDEQRQEAKFAKPAKSDEKADPVTDEEVLDTYFKKTQDSTTRKPLPVSKRTPAIRRALSKMSQANQKEALLNLGTKTDEELAKTEQNLLKYEERMAQREAEKGRGQNLELPVNESQRMTPKSEAFVKKVSDLLAMREQTQFFRDTLKQMQDALTELDKALRSKKTIREDGKTFEAVDLSDEHAYLWSEGQGFNIPKNLPQEKALALRRKLVDQIREMQQQSIQGQADLFLNSLARLDYELSLLRNQAMREGVSQSVIDQTYNAAREVLVGIRNEFQGKPQSEIAAEIPAGMNEVQADFFEQDLAARNLVASLKAEKREDRISTVDALKAAMRGIREGEFTYGDLLRVMQESGVSIPHEMFSVAGHIAMQSRMLDHVKNAGYSTAAKMNWLRSMDSVVTRFPQMLDGDNFTDAEKLQYQEWKDARETLKARLKKDETMLYSNDIEEAFPGMLWQDYTLGRLRKEDIPAARLSALKDTVGDLVEGWFQDLAYSLHTRPDLRQQIEAAIRPEDMTEFRQWLEQKQRAVEQEAKLVAKIPYFQAIRSFPGMGLDEKGNPVNPAQYNKYYTMLANAQINELDKIMANAEAVGNSVATSDREQRNLEARIADFMDGVMEQEDLGHYDPEISGTMGRETFAQSDESVEDLANEDEGFDFDSEYGDEGELRWVRNGFFSGVLTAAQVQATVAKVTASWKSAPQITVLQNASMLPEPLRSRVLEKLESDTEAKGLFDEATGQVYLFSDMMTSEADTQFVLFHEVYGHLGLRAFLGEKFDTFLENMYRTYPAIRKQVDAMVDAGMAKLEAIDEVIADMAGKNEQSSIVKGWIGRIIAGLRNIGLNKVADWMGTVTNAELAFYLQGAREAAQTGEYLYHGAPGNVRLAEAVQHERLYEMYALNNGMVGGFARFNAATQTWTVFTAGPGGDVTSGDRQVFTTKDYADVVKAMKVKGRLEFRKRSGVFIDHMAINDRLIDLVTPMQLGPVKSWMRNLITQYQNEYRPVFDLVEYLRSEGRVTERMDVKDALLRYERKLGRIIQLFRMQTVRPIYKLVEEAGQLGADKQTIERFLLARHAEERNNRIARINPKFPDGGSGMKTQDAADYLKSLEDKPYFQTLQEIGELTDKMSRQKLKYLFRTGMITAKQYEDMSNYQHYVNLSGMNSDLNLDDFDDPAQMVAGSKFNVKGKEKMATGRSTEAVEILERTILGMEAALIRGQKNQVAQRVLALLEANYDPNFATINRIKYKQVFGDDGMVTEKEDDQYIRNKNVMVAKINGIPNTIEFKDASAGSFADAIHGMVYPQPPGDWMVALGKVNQFVGQLLTTLNPAWVPVNFARDAQSMFFNAASDGRITKEQAWQMVQALPSSIKTAYFMARSESDKTTRVNPDPEMVRLYREMAVNGGMTSFLNRKGLEDQVNEIERLLGMHEGAAKVQDKWNAFVDFMENLTLPMEVAPRLAAYKVMRENGFSEAEASVFAGEITVNFNMRGANKNVRQLYLFFNPAVQGSSKLLSLFATLGPDYKLRFKTKGFAYVGAFIALGMMSNLVARVFGDDDEAGRNDLDKIPVYKRATSLIIAPGVPGAAIPIPYGWNAFYAMGHFMMDTMLGIQPPAETAKRIAKTAFESFSPLGSAGLDSQTLVGTALKVVAPTAVLPMVEWALNENRFGAPIYRDDSLFGGAKIPNSQQYFRSVSPISRSITDELNNISGGNKFKSGAIDVNPAAIDFVIGAYMPGFINEVYKLASTGVRAARGEEIRNTPLPLIDRLTAKVPDSYDSGAFRRAKELIETKYEEYKNVPEARDQIRESSPGLLQAHAVVASTTQEIRRVRSNLTKIENNPGIPDAEKVERLNAARERERMLYTRAVKAVMNAGPEFRDAVMASD